MRKVDRFSDPRFLVSAFLIVTTVLGGLTFGCAKKIPDTSLGSMPQPVWVPMPALKTVDLGELVIDRSGKIAFHILPKDATVRAEITDATSVQLRMYTVGTDVADPFLVKNMVESPSGVWTISIPSLLPQGVHINIWAETKPGATIPKDQITAVDSGRTWVFLYGAHIRN